MVSHPQNNATFDPSAHVWYEIPTWMVDVYGFHVGLPFVPMDPSWEGGHRHDLFVSGVKEPPRSKAISPQ